MPKKVSLINSTLKVFINALPYILIRIFRRHCWLVWLMLRTASKTRPGGLDLTLVAAMMMRKTLNFCGLRNYQGRQNYPQLGENFKIIIFFLHKLLT